MHGRGRACARLALDTTCRRLVDHRTRVRERQPLALTAAGERARERAHTRGVRGACGEGRIERGEAPAGEARQRSRAHAAVEVRERSRTHACACTPTRKYTGALLRNQHTWYALSLTLQAGKLMRVVGTRSLGVKASMLAGNVLPLQTAHTCIRIDM